MNQLAVWLDNPILVKHERSRLRPLALASSLAVAAILALSIVLVGYNYDHLHGGGTFGALMVLQTILLGFMGASQIGSSLGKAREAGILDFHRTTPMSALALVMGFFFGAPIREYAMFAVTLPFSLICVLAGTPTPLGAVQLLVPLIMGSWVFHASSLLTALGGKPAKSGSRGIIGLVVVLIFGGGYMAWGFIRAAESIDESSTVAFYGLDIPWLLLLALYLLPTVGFILTGATRRMASERAHVLSKPQAVACLSTAAVLVLGSVSGMAGSASPTLPVLYGLVLGAVFMASAVTPGLDEFSKGVRKASKEGQKYPATWSDRGLNRVVVFVLAGIVLVVSTVVWKVIEDASPPPGAVAVAFPRPVAVSYSLPIAIAVMTVAYYGLALQFFQLRFGKRGVTVFALFLFVVWLLPLVAGAIAGASAANNLMPGAEPNVWPAALASLSPIFGIAASSGITGSPGSDAVNACALVPALVFALLFNNLVTVARRRVQKQIHPEPFPDPRPKPSRDEVSEPAVVA